MRAQDLRQALECGKSSCACHRASGTTTHCVAHDDSNVSLSITDGTTAPLFHCFTGCDSADIIAALKARGLWELPENVSPMRNARDPQAVYRYTDADGNLVAEKGRFESMVEGKRTKSFLWRLAGQESWNGLGGLGQDQMPLYNLAGVLAHPDKAVLFVEGEKAANALIDRGVVAVCLGFGAAQKRFGNALDPLRDRDVVLWPDNDEAGQAFMALIASLLPQAQYLRPIVPPKGDAYDYFEQGGTLAALEDLRVTSTPAVRAIAADAIEVEMPHPTGSVTFTFTEMAWTSRATECHMAVDVRITGQPRVPFNTRINLGSSSGREGIRRELEAIYGKTVVEWSRMLSTACSEADRTWKGTDLSVDLYDVQEKQRSWFLDQRIPSQAVSILFGMGGSMKSLIVLDMALHSLLDASWMGLPLTPSSGLLVIDYEDTEDEWRVRVAQVCRANGWDFTEGMFRYLPGNAIPVHEQAQRIRKIVTEHGIDLIIVDSASSASGGDLLDTVSVSRVVNFLQSLGVTVLMTAHNTKAEDSNFPYGSVMWSNLVRSTHYVESKQEEGSKTAFTTIHNRKANRGKQLPIGLRVDFPDSDDGSIRITRDHQSINLTASTGEVTHTWRIGQWLERQPKPQPVSEIARSIQLSEAHVRRELNRRPDVFVNVGEGKAGLWTVLSKREDDPQEAIGW